MVQKVEVGKVAEKVVKNVSYAFRVERGARWVRRVKRAMPTRGIQVNPPLGGSVVLQIHCGRISIGASANPSYSTISTRLAERSSSRKCSSSAIWALGWSARKSGDETLTSRPETPIPLSVFQTWYTNFTRKIENDKGASFLDRVD